VQAPADHLHRCRMLQRRIAISYQNSCFAACFQLLLYSGLNGESAFGCTWVRG